MRFHEVSKAYGQGTGRRAALRDVDLSITAGELVAVVGPSGSGKTTILNLIAGLDRPDAGRVVFDGVDLATLSDRELSALRNRSVGFVFQAFHLLDHLSVGENVALPGYFAATPLPPDRRAARAREVLERVGLDDRADATPSELSGGQRQRVAIARALFREPALLLADEPTGNLDTETGAEVLDLFARLHAEEGTAIVVVTHERETCDRADRMVLLRDGRVEA